MRRLTKRQRVAAIVLTVVALAFITLDLGGGSLGNAHDGVRGALGSLYRGTDSVLGPVRRWVQGVPGAGSSQSRIDALRRSNAELRAQLARAQADARVSAQVAQLQHAANASGERVLPALVTAYGPGQGFDWTVTLDVGSTSGVRAGQTVMSGAALVGRVLHADADSSVVLLAADPGSGVGVRDLRTGELGVVTGRGAAGFSFAPLKPGAQVHVGDRLQTGPTSASRYLAGLSVGIVTSVRASADGTVRAVVAPTTSPTAVDVVGVVVGAQPAVADRAALQPKAAR
ncbi:rod shape-determining protein MreC [uncultured Jatrophihabitans sp.]|uniref:rod shape-determining protein MreC n=1 Tax=uncultured Jatrophihabitans sp. TaxID=1610747 RepID=UPI0035CC1326